MYFICVYCFGSMLMTSSFVGATPTVGRKRITYMEHLRCRTGSPVTLIMSKDHRNHIFFKNMNIIDYFRLKKNSANLKIIFFNWPINFCIHRKIWPEYVISAENLVSRKFFWRTWYDQMLMKANFIIYRLYRNIFRNLYMLG